MTALSLFTTIVNVSNIIRELEVAGMRLEIGGDFGAYRKLRHAQADRPPLYPIFDVASSFIDDSNAFWVCGFNDKNELIHTQVIRHIDMTGTNLRHHLEHHRHKYLTPGMIADPDHIQFSELPSLEHITGRVCYHGEFWLKGGDGGLRNQGFTSLMSRIVFEIALKLWSPDYLFGFVPMELAMKGIPVRYGYTRCELGAWVGPDEQVAAEETFVWMSRAEMEQFLESSPTALSQERKLPTRQELMRNMSVVA